MDTDIKSTAMRLLDISSQPFPVPINSVENLEVIFDSSKESYNIFKYFILRESGKVTENMKN